MNAARKPPGRTPYETLKSKRCTGEVGDDLGKAHEDRDTFPAPTFHFIGVFNQFFSKVLEFSYGAHVPRRKAFTNNDKHVRVFHASCRFDLEDTDRKTTFLQKKQQKQMKDVFLSRG